jgi:dipeptidyl aminopeptidase/acylaminoacyl peptidase
MKHKGTFRMLSLGVLASLMMIPALSFGAAKPDFSGQWTLNESKSEVGEGRFFSAAKMSVKQEGNTLTIERTRTTRNGEERTTSETLTMDGKENISEGNNRKTTSVVTWSDDGNTVTIRTTREFNRQGETFEMNTTEVWSLSDGGNTLTIQSDSSSRMGDRSATLVYNKN